jgi:flagellar biosynthetic protein FliR
MPAELPGLETLAPSFLLALGRVAGVITFVPLPGVRSGLEPARAALALAVTVALFPFWPSQSGPVTVGWFVVRLAAEALAGVAIGLAVGFVTDAFGFAMQMAGLQAGYSFASTFDPNSQADSTVLVVMAQLGAGLLFLAAGLDREIFRALALSLAATPLGAVSPAEAPEFLKLGSAIFTTGLRLAAPVCVLLLMLELALALAARANSQLQMLTAAFPLKMLAGIAVLALILPRVPLLFSAQARQALTAVAGLLGD